MYAAVADDGVLEELWLPNRRKDWTAKLGSTQAADAFERLTRQLDEYFRGRRRVFDIPMRTAGSQFEASVWHRLQRIPYGCTISYGEIARDLGLQNGARAVGRANGANPIPILIPCHRVIGADGSLVGFGGGIRLKRYLLELEGAIEPPLRLL
jgi:O-6-methylguanine DNA methyltransferase